MDKSKVVVAVSVALTSMVAWAGDTVPVAAETEPATQLEPIQVRTFPDSGYAVTNSSVATRTDTPIKEIPQSIHIIPRVLLDDQQSVTVSEALENVSGVTANNPIGTPAQDSTRIRGFRAEQLLDGFTQYYNPGDRESTINIRQIEVLKGANAVLYSGGSGTPVGGVVNVLSKLPQSQAFGTLGIKLGNNSFAEPFFDINQPLNENVLFRITGEYTKTDSNVDVVDQERYNINPSITLTDNDKVTLTVQGKTARWRQQEYQGLPAVGTVSGAFNLKSDMFIGPDNIPDSKSDFDGIWAAFDYKISEAWSFNAKARFSKSSFDEYAQTIGSNSPDRLDVSPTSWSVYNTELSQSQTERTVLANTTFKFDLGKTKHTVLLGADYSKFKDDGYIDFDANFNGDVLKLLAFGHADCAAQALDALAVFFGATCSAATVDLTNPAYAAYARPGAGVDNTFVTNTTYGFYAQLQSTIHDRFHLLASVRQAHVGIDYTGPEMDSAATLANVLGGVYTAVYTQSSANTEEDKLLPRLGGVFDISKSFSVFANYSEGMRGQPFALFTGAPKPEHSRQKEGGLKFDNGTWAGQLAIYKIDRSNVAVTDPASASFRSLTDGEQQSKGLDADLTWHPTPAFSFLVNYAHTDAEFTKTVTGARAGNQLPGVPQNSGRIWANYVFQQQELKGFSIGLGVYLQSGGYVDNANLYKTDSYHRIDAALSYQAERYNVGLTVKNLTNEDYYQYYSYLGGRVAPDPGTTAYLSVAVKY